MPLTGEDAEATCVAADSLVIPDMDINDPRWYELTSERPCYDCDGPTFKHFDLEGRCEACYLSLK